MPAKTPKPRPVGTDWTIEEVLDNAIHEVGEGVAWFKGRPPDEQLRTGYKDGKQAQEEQYMLAGQLLAVYVGMATRLSAELRAISDPKKSGQSKPKDMAALIAAELRDKDFRAEVLALVRAQEQAS